MWHTPPRKEQVKAQQLLIQSARGSYAPSIALRGSFIQATESGTNYTGWNVAGGVTLTWNPFQGGLTNGSGSVIELGDEQIAASNAAAQVVQTDYQLATAWAQLLFALGRA